VEVTDMQPRARLWIAAVLASAAACANPSAARQTEDLQVDQPVTLQSDLPSSLAGDNYQIVGIPAAVNDSLQVTVQYGGGCQRHEFSLHASRVFMESHPVQSPIVLHHNANGDTCRALLSRDLRFDLTPLRDAWRTGYQQRHGTIILRLRGYGNGISYTF
jgi:hypothetical protein